LGTSKPYDLLVLGGGPGGYVAAVRGAQLGARVALIERDALGGTCLNRGCIPTKALIESARVLSLSRKMNAFGVEGAGTRLNYPAVIRRKEQIVSRLADGVEGLMRGNGIDVHRGNGMVLSPGCVKVQDRQGGEVTLEGGKIILATGSRPARLKLPGIDSPGVVFGEEALSLAELPGSVIIIGGGVIGVEFACLYKEFGCQVVIVEMENRILPREDREISAHLQKRLSKDGIAVLTGACIESIEGERGAVGVILRHGSESMRLSAALALVAVGRAANVEALGNLPLRYDRGFVVTNARMETGISGVFAVGDLRGGMLAHVASAEGIVAAGNALGHETVMDYRSVPGCVFSSPELASVGLSEEEAGKKGYEVEVGRFSFAASGRALAMEEGDGFVKIVSEKSIGEILGVHIIGPHASDLIGEAVLAMKLEATAEELARTIHPHPTLTEAVMEAGADTLGEAIHVLRRKRQPVLAGRLRSTVEQPV